MDNLWLPIILAVIAAVPGLLTLWRQLRRDNVDTTTTYKGMFDDELSKRRDCEKRCDELNDEIDMLELDCASQERYIRRLVAYIEYTGGDVPLREDTKPKGKGGGR